MTTQLFLTAALTVTFFLPAFAVAEDRDAQEVMSYTLTEAGLAKYTQATKKLAALPTGAPNACEEEDSDSQSQAQSVDEIAAVLDAAPGAKAAIASAGMTTREYVIFSLSVFHNGMAAWAVSQPGGKLPPGTSKGNVDFYQAHEAELASLGELTKSADCDAEQTGDEDDDENEE
jgi:hypothetical protein